MKPADDRESILARCLEGPPLGRNPRRIRSPQKVRFVCFVTKVTLGRDEAPR